MSDTVLKLIPVDPAFVPDPSVHGRAVEVLEDVACDGAMAQAEAYDEVRFVDPGGFLEGVSCPACGARTSIDPFVSNDAGTRWWYATTEALETAPAHRLATRLPCCDAEVAFTSLRFDPAGGFARFELSIWNPDLDAALDADAMRRLEDAVGCRLQQVWARY